MIKKEAFESLDRNLQDIMNCNSLFGGQIMVFGGDFRQVLPVLKKGTRDEIVAASLRRSYLWPLMRKLKLTQNMRASADPSFSNFLLTIGDGKEKTVINDSICLPDDISLNYVDDERSRNELIDTIFPSIHVHGCTTKYITNRAILTTKNVLVDGLNNELIGKFPGEEVDYYSYDSAIDDEHNHYPLEFLNSLTPNGLPPPQLRLKINCPIMLLRNLDPSNGLCNDTRLICKSLERNVIDAEISVGQHAGKRVYISRIPLCPSEDDGLPFTFKRKQFRIHLSFAMTINKAQGQTIPTVGVYLPQPVFSHDQLYVAQSRGKSRVNTKVLVKPMDDHFREGSYTKNIVHKEVLTDDDRITTS